MDEMMKGLAAMLPPEMGLDALPHGMKDALMQVMRKKPGGGAALGQAQPGGGAASGQIGGGGAS